MAASFDPSDEDVIEIQDDDGADVKVHDTPPSVLMYMPPLSTTAASLEPSDEDVIDLH